jgi:hypothetical protein
MSMPGTVLEMLMATRARQLQPEERLPPEVRFSMDGLVLDPEWVWVVEEGGQVQAALMAMHGHQVAVLMRLAARPTAHLSVLVPLFRKMFKDLRDRGIQAYVVMLDTRVPTEAKLGEVAKRMGAVELDDSCTVMAGPMIPETR